ncbi:MAG: carboxypeptidase-like regulatory domain-containing protein [Ekhidna sp.]
MMRFTSFILLLVLSCSLHAQKQYQFDFKDENLLEVVEGLSATYKFKFSFSPKALAKHTLNKRVRVNSDAELISEIFDGLPFKLQLSDGVYLLIPQKVKPKPVALLGKVYDSQSGEPLAFAHVSTKNKGVISNQSGRFSLPPRADTLTLKVSYLGYKNVELKVAPTDENITLEMVQNPQILQEVILNSAETSQLSAKPSFFSLNPKKFSALPTLGETDVFKTIQLLPGVQATDETSSGLAVRGGIPSQNLVLMDGFTLYNLDHFFGIFSTLNPNIINNISIHKGGFGAEYGGRVSSVIDITGKNGNSEKFSGGAGINLLSANAYIETPLGKKTSLLLGVRQSFSDVVNSNLYKDFLTSNRRGFLNSIDTEFGSLEISPTIDFNDFNAKVQHRFNETSTINLSFFQSEDRYNGDAEEEDEFFSFEIEDAANWTNAGISIQLDKQFNTNWFGNLTVSASEFSEDESLKVTSTFFDSFIFGDDSLQENSIVDFFDYGVNSSIGDFTIKSDHEISINEKHHLKTGVEVNTINTSYNSDQLYFTDFSSDTIYQDTLNFEASISSLYLSHQFQTKDFSSNIGIRSTYYDPNGEWYLEPRLSLNFQANDKLTIKGAASYHHQFITKTSLSIFQNADQKHWVLADDEVIPIQKSTHFILGGNYSLKNWTFDLEYYRKNTKGIIDNFLDLPPEVVAELGFEGINLSGENNSNGLDLFIKYRTGKFSSWVSYSLSSSENQFFYRDNNTAYPSDQDQRHELNFSSMIKLGKWELSSIILFGSGRPFTPPNPDVALATSSGSFDQLYDLSSINSERHPAYKRVDVSAKYSFAIGKIKCEAGLTLFNLLNHSNIKSRRYFKQFVFDEISSIPDAEDEIRIVPLDTYLLGFTPNFFIQVRF